LNAGEISFYDVDLEFEGKLRIKNKTTIRYYTEKEFVRIKPVLEIFKET